VSSAVTAERPLASARRLILPLALAQFICSFAGSNMNVMIADISDDLDTTVKGVQTAITLFLLIMAILMIPCSKLTDRWGRKRCFIGGLTIYGIGALVSAVSPNLGVLILGNSVLEGVGTALLIPGPALVGLGLGAMLTPSVNVVQSSFPEALQGEISGLSRSVSNLGSSFGTAIAGTILVSELATGNRGYAWAMVALVVFGLIGLGAAVLLPAKLERA
jgi:MFS family permease